MSKKISSIITQNVQNGAAQAMLYGVGLTKPDLSKYMVGIGSMQFDFNPCNKHLGNLSAGLGGRKPDSKAPIPQATGLN